MQHVRKKPVDMNFVPIVIAIDTLMPNVQNVHLDHHQKATMKHRTDVNHVKQKEIYADLDA